MKEKQKFMVDSCFSNKIAEDESQFGNNLLNFKKGSIFPNAASIHTHTHTHSIAHTHSAMSLKQIYRILLMVVEVMVVAVALVLALLHKFSFERFALPMQFQLSRFVY